MNDEIINGEAIIIQSQQVWERDWLLRGYGYYCIVWQCNSQPCYPDCQWGVGLGQWYVKQIYKLGDDVYLPFSAQ